jgi:HK97 family phage major capsid protein
MQHGLPGRRSDLVTSSATLGGNIVGTTLLASSFIELLRNKLLAPQLGVQMLTGLVGKIAFPKQTAAGTFSWVGEAGAGSDTNLTVGQVTMTPYEGRAYQEYSTMLMLQGTPSIELLVINDLTRIAQIGLDAAVFHGSASANQPRGIANESGVGSVSAASCGWDAILEFESDVATANADALTMFFAMNPAARAILKGRPKALNTAAFLMDEKGLCNGYESKVSNQINSGYIFFGDFSHEIIGWWGGVQVIVNPYSKDTDGLVRVTVSVDVDCRLRQAGAISVASDLT